LNILQRPYVEAWSPACGATGRWWKPYEVEPHRRKLGSLGTCFAVLPPPLSIFASWTP
jgi:hypothetical protein